MALPNVKIILQNGQLGGLIGYAEGVAGLVGTGVAVADKIQIGSPQVLFSLSDATNIGIDEKTNPVAYKHIKEFYAEATTGAELYIMLVPDTMTQADIMDNTNDNGACKLLNYAQGRIRLLGSFFTPPESNITDVNEALDDDVYQAITNAQLLATRYADNQTPVRCLIEGLGFSGDATKLKPVNTMTYNRVAVLIGSSQPDGSASTGLALGRLAKIPVQRKISRIKDGALAITKAYIGSTPVEDFTALPLVYDKGYMVLRTFAGFAGYFFSNDLTCTPKTDDYNALARGRVIDKAQVITYLTYLEELHDEIVINQNGTISIGLINYLQAKLENQINESMTANGQISSVKVTIDANQNILATDILQVVVKIIPVGYASEIIVKLGFENPNN